jgi:hypothetical protein
MLSVEICAGRKINASEYRKLLQISGMAELSVKKNNK